MSTGLSDQLFDADFAQQVEERLAQEDAQQAIQEDAAKARRRELLERSQEGQLFDVDFALDVEHMVAKADAARRKRHTALARKHIGVGQDRPGRVAGHQEFIDTYRNIPVEDRESYLQTLSEVASQNPPANEFDPVESLQRGLEQVVDMPQGVARTMGMFSPEETATLDFYNAAEAIRRGAVPLRKELGTGALATAGELAQEAVGGVLEMAPAMYAGGAFGKAVGVGSRLAGASATGAGTIAANAGIGYWAAQELPQLYDSARQMGVDDDSARVGALIAAPIVGAMERIQFGRVSEPLKGLVRRRIQENALNYTMRAGKEFTTSTLVNVAQEGGQQGVGTAMRAVLAALDDEVLSGEGEWAQFGRDELEDMKTTLRQAALSMPLLQAPGTMAQVSADVQKRRAIEAVNERRERLRGLRELRAQGPVSRRNARDLGIEGTTQEERTKNTDAEIQQLEEQEIQDAEAVRGPEEEVREDEGREDLRGEGEIEVPAEPTGEVTEAQEVVEPPVPEGRVRFYHAGELEAGEPRWLSQDRKWAEDFRPGAPISYVDLPADSPLLSKAFDDEGTDQIAPFNNFEAPPEIADQLRPLTAPESLAGLPGVDLVRPTPPVEPPAVVEEDVTEPEVPVDEAELDEALDELGGLLPAEEEEPQTPREQWRSLEQQEAQAWSIGDREAAESLAEQRLAVEKQIAAEARKAVADTDLDDSAKKQVTSDVAREAIGSDRPMEDIVADRVQAFKDESARLQAEAEERIRQREAEAEPTEEETPWQAETRGLLAGVPAFEGADVQLDEEAGTATIVRPDGLKTTIHFNEDEKLAALAKRMGEEGAKGAYIKKVGTNKQFQESHIYLATDVSHETVNHEVIHFLEDKGVITPQEVAENGGSEKLARAYGEWAADPNRKPNNLFQKIYDFLDKVFSSQRRLFEEIGARQVPAQEETQPQDPRKLAEWLGLPEGLQLPRVFDNNQFQIVIPSNREQEIVDLAKQKGLRRYSRGELSGGMLKLGFAPQKPKAAKPKAPVSKEPPSEPRPERTVPRPETGPRPPAGRPEVGPEVEEAAPARRAFRPGEQMGLFGMEEEVARANEQERRLNAFRKTPIYDKLVQFAGDDAAAREFADANMETVEAIPDAILANVQKHAEDALAGFEHDEVLEALPKTEVPEGVDEGTYLEFLTDEIYDRAPEVAKEMTEVGPADNRFKIGDAVYDDISGDSGRVDSFEFDDNDIVAVVHDPKTNSDEKVRFADLRHSEEEEAAEEPEVQPTEEAEPSPTEAPKPVTPKVGAKPFREQMRAKGAASNDQISVKVIPHRFAEDRFELEVVSKDGKRTYTGDFQDLENVQEAGAEILESPHGITPQQMVDLLPEGLRELYEEGSRSGQLMLDFDAQRAKVLQELPEGVSNPELIGQTFLAPFFQRSDNTFLLYMGGELVPVQGMNVRAMDANPAEANVTTKPQKVDVETKDVRHILQWTDETGKNRERSFAAYSMAKREADRLEKTGLKDVGINTITTPRAELEVKASDAPQSVKYTVKGGFDVSAMDPDIARQVMDDVKVSSYGADPLNVALRDALQEKADESAKPKDEKDLEDAAARRKVSDAKSEAHTERENAKRYAKKLYDEKVVEIARSYGVPKGRGHLNPLSGAKKWQDRIANSRAEARRDSEVVQAEKDAKEADQKYQELASQEAEVKREQVRRDHQRYVEQFGEIEPGEIRVSRKLGPATALRMDHWAEGDATYYVAQGAFVESTGQFYQQYDHLQEMTPYAVFEAYGTVDESRTVQAVKMQVDEALEKAKKIRSDKEAKKQAKERREKYRQQFRTDNPVKATPARMLPIEKQHKWTKGGKPAVGTGSWVIWDAIPKELTKRRAEVVAHKKGGELDTESNLDKFEDQWTDKTAKPLKSIGYLESEDVVTLALLTDGESVIVVDADYHDFFTSRGFTLAGGDKVMKENNALQIRKGKKIVGVLQPFGAVTSEGERVVKLSEVQEWMPQKIGRKPQPVSEAEATETAAEQASRMTPDAYQWKQGGNGLQAKGLKGYIRTVKAEDQIQIAAEGEIQDAYWISAPSAQNPKPRPQQETHYASLDEAKQALIDANEKYGKPTAAEQAQRAAARPETELAGGPGDVGPLLTPAEYVSQPPETSQGKRTINRLKNDTEGTKVGFRQIVKDFTDALQAEMRIGSEQLRSPGQYQRTPHLIRSMSDVGPWNFHEQGHALAEVLSQNERFSGWMAENAEELIALTQRDGTAASADTEWEGFAELVRLSVTAPDSVPAPLQQSMFDLLDVELGRGKLAAALRDAHRGLVAHMQRPVMARQRSHAVGPRRGAGNAVTELVHRTMYNLMSAEAAVSYRLENPIVNAALTAGKVIGKKVDDRVQAVRDWSHYLWHISGDAGGAIFGRQKQRGATVMAPRQWFSETQIEQLEEAGAVIPESQGEGNRIQLTDYTINDIAVAVGRQKWHEFLQYAQSKSALERWEKHGHEYPGRSAGESPEQLRRALQETESNNPEFEEQQSRLTSFLRQIMLLNVLSGEVTTDEYQKMVEAHEFYVPLPRQVEQGQSRLGSSAGQLRSQLRRAHGSVLPFQDLQHAISSHVQAAYRAYYHNAVRNAVKNMQADIQAMEDVPAEAKWAAQRVMVPLRLDAARVATLNRSEMQEVIAEYLNETEEYEDNPIDPKDIDVNFPGKPIIRSKSPRAVNVLTRFEDGTVKFEQVKDELLYDFFTRVESPSKVVQWLSNFFGGPGQAIKDSITNSVSFVPRAIFRDLFGNVVLGRGMERYIPGVYWAAGSANQVANLFGAGDKSVKVDTELLSNSFKHTHSDQHILGVNRFVDFMSQGVLVDGWKHMNWLDRLQYAPGQVAWLAYKPFQALNFPIRYASQWAESTPREGAALVAKRKGATDIRSTRAYDEISGNFISRPGSNVIASIYRFAMFLNPGMQVIYQVAERATQKRSRGDQAVALAYLGAMSSLAAVVTWALMDDEEREQYTEQPEDGKLRDLPVKAPGLPMLRMPVPYGPEGAVVGYTFNKTMEQLSGVNIDDRKLLAQAARRTADMPMLSSLATPIGLTTIEATANYSFWLQRAIVPESLKTFYRDDPAAQTYESTPEFYKRLGEKLEVSPIMAEYVVGNLVGTQVEETVRTVSILNKGKLPKDLSEYPQIGRLFWRPSIGYRAASVKYINEQSDAFDKARRAVTRKAGVDDRVRKDFRATMKYKAAAKHLRKMGTKARNLYKNGKKDEARQVREGMRDEAQRLLKDAEAIDQLRQEWLRGIVFNAVKDAETDKTKETLEKAKRELAATRLSHYEAQQHLFNHYSGDVNWDKAYALGELYGHDREAVQDQLRGPKSGGLRGTYSPELGKRVYDTEFGKWMQKQDERWKAELKKKRDARKK